MSKITITHLQKMKQDGQKITAITAYDATFAKLFDDEGAQASSTASACRCLRAMA